VHPPAGELVQEQAHIIYEFYRHGLFWPRNAMLCTFDKSVVVDVHLSYAILVNDLDQHLFSRSAPKYNANHAEDFAAKHTYPFEING
jgi:hypothetical protein